DDAKSLVLADADGDGVDELIVGVNNGPLRAFGRAAPLEGRLVRVRLVGGPGNPQAVGARVTVQLTDGREQTAEVYAGSGYLSQSAPPLTFGSPELDAVARITV